MRKKRDTPSRLQNLSFLVIILIAIPVSTYKLGRLPLLHGDEGASGVQATFFINGAGNIKDAFKMGWGEQPLISFIFQSWFLKVAGVNIFGLRLASVFFGLISIIPFFILARYFLSFSSPEAVVTTCFYVFSHWFIAASRIGINYNQILPFQLFSLFFLWLGAKKRLKLSLVLSGMISGFCVYLYHAGRITPFIIIACFFLLKIKKNNPWKKIILEATFLLLGIAISLIPFATNYLKTPEQFFVRTKDVIILNKFGQLKNQYQVSNKLAVIGYQFLNTIKIFFIGGDNNEQYGYQGPMIPFVFQPLFVFGLFLLITSFFKKTEGLCVFFWISAILFFGGILTTAAPNFCRLISLLPFIFLTTGLGVNKIGSWIKKKNKKFFFPFLAVLTSLWIATNIKIYFVDYLTSLKGGWANYDPGTSLGYYFADLGSNWEAIFFGCWKHYPTQGNIGFLAPRFPVHGEIPFPRAIQMAQDNPKNFVFVFLPYEISQQRNWWESYRKNKPLPNLDKFNWQEEILALKQAFPYGKIKTFHRSDQTEFFTSYEITKK